MEVHDFRVCKPAYRKAYLRILLVEDCVVVLEESEAKDPGLAHAFCRHRHELEGAIVVAVVYIRFTRDHVVKAVDVEHQVRERIVLILAAVAVQDPFDSTLVETKFSLHVFSELC